MSLATLMMQTVTIVTPTTRTDGYGDTATQWTGAGEVTTTGWLAQSSSLADLDGRDATSTALTLTLPADAVITAKCRVRIASRLYEIEGEPLKAWTPAGVHHIECQLKVVDG